MVLLNTGPGSVDADAHDVPTVNLPAADLDPVRAYAATAGATATIHAATVIRAPTPRTASSSSRGPTRVAEGDLLKPDLVAPGEDVLAAVAPERNDGSVTELRSGTSVSAAQVAGLAALLGDAHPSWSPMAIKSALMTTGGDALDGSQSDPSVVFRQGAGHVRPASAADPGLVYDSRAPAWLALLCGQTGAVDAATCASARARGYPTDPSELNAASVAIGRLPGRASVTRTVTNVGATRSTYRASVHGLAGLSTTVTPATMTLDPGASATFTVTFQRTNAALGRYASGSLQWDDGTHVVRSPVVVRPVALIAPDAVTASPSGTAYDVALGYTGDFAAVPRGPVAAVVSERVVADDPTDSACGLNTPGATRMPVAVPSGTTLARFALSDADVAAGTDLDLCVFDASDALVGVSASPASEEEVDLTDPPAGAYTVVVQGRRTDGVVPVRLSTWLLGTSSSGAMTVAAPGSASAGARGSISVAFTGLGTGRWLASVAYRTPTGTTAPTLVRVDVP